MDVARPQRYGSPVQGKLYKSAKIMSYFSSSQLCDIIRPDLDTELRMEEKFESIWNDLFSEAPKDVVSVD